MLGKMIGAVAGKRMAERSGSSGVGGALLGAGAATLVRRLGPLGLLAAVVGGYALKRRHQK